MYLALFNAKHELHHHHHHHHHHVHEGLGMFPVPWSSRCSSSLHLFLGRPTFLRPFGLYCSACFGSLFVSILSTCCSHFFWYCFISFTMFCAPVFSLIHWFFSLCSFVIPSKCLKNFICAASKRCSSLFLSTQASLQNFNAALAVMLWILNFVSLFICFPKCLRIAPLILLYVCSLSSKSFLYSDIHYPGYYKRKIFFTLVVKCVDIEWFSTVQNACISYFPRNVYVPINVQNINCFPLPVKLCYIPNTIRLSNITQSDDYKPPLKYLTGRVMGYFH